jgi:hypothetical protein
LGLGVGGRALEGDRIAERMRVSKLCSLGLALFACLGDSIIKPLM